MSARALTPKQIEILTASPALADYFEDAVDGGDRLARRAAALPPVAD
jgi:Asp-tRNA(Asn)/Glu-tRNA(Gln) amidotransferase B subunit